MTSYAILDALFLAGAAAVVLLLRRHSLLREHGPLGRHSSLRRRPQFQSYSARLWGPVLAGGLCLLVLTAIFDNVMIALGLFAYRAGSLSGMMLGRAPLEDFAYPVAAAVLLPVLWSWQRRSEIEAESKPEPDSREPT
ncbi:hypothetical protein [Sinomonas albida]|uniref:hypothetical protein n=1 Tax=Sinomonas albida TaxID=369942 RepID=UPI003016548F